MKRNRFSSVWDAIEKPSRLDLFSLDTLVDMASHVGFEVGIKLSRRRVA